MPNKPLNLCKICCYLTILKFPEAIKIKFTIRIEIV